MESFEDKRHDIRFTITTQGSVILGYQIYLLNSSVTDKHAVITPEEYRYTKEDNSEFL
jgi:hypothetical protein